MGLVAAAAVHLDVVGAGLDEPCGVLLLVAMRALAGVAWRVGGCVHATLPVLGRVALLVTARGVEPVLHHLALAGDSEGVDPLAKPGHA